MVYTPVIDDKPADVIICSLHCVGVDANVGIIEGDLVGDLEGFEEEVFVGVLVGVNEGADDGSVVGMNVGIAVGDFDGIKDGSIDGLHVGTLGCVVGDDVGAVVPKGSHSNTYLSYELRAMLDIAKYSISPPKC